MDPLRKHVFEALQAVTCGDEKIDDSLKTVAAHVKGILRAHGAELEHIERNKSQYTAKGQSVQREKAAKKAQKDLLEVQEKSSWKSDIETIEKKFDVAEDKTDLQILIEEGRQREVRQHMREVAGDGEA